MANKLQMFCRYKDNYNKQLCAVKKVHASHNATYHRLNKNLTFTANTLPLFFVIKKKSATTLTLNEKNPLIEN